MTTSRRGAGLVLISAAGFGVSPVFAKAAYAAGVTVPTMLSVRFAIAAAVLWAVTAWRRPGWPPRRVLLAGVGLGAVGYASQSALFFGALARIDASLAALLLYVYPVLVTALAVVLRRETPNRRRLVALGCSAVGVLLLLGTGGGGGTGGSVAVSGVLLALGAAAMYALYLTIADGLPAQLDLYLLSAVVCTAAAVSLGSAGLVTGSLRAAAEPIGWLWIVLLALVSTVLPVSCLFGGLRAVGAPTAAILSCAEPAVTVALTVVVYGERLSPGQAVGAVVILGAVAALRLRSGLVEQTG